MSGYCAPELQRAVLALLRANVALTSEVGDRIFDTAPANTTYPCVAINMIEVTPRDTDSSDGSETTVTLSVFTLGPRARVDAQRVNAKIIDAVHGRAAGLTMTGHKAVNCRLISSVVFRTEDQKGGAHGVSRFMVQTESLAAIVGA